MGESIRSNPHNHAAEGDEHRWELSILVGPCSQEAAHEFLLAIEHKFGEHLFGAYAVRRWEEEEGATTKDAAAKRLGVHPNTVGSWAARGLLESSGEGYSAESVEALREKITGEGT